jgi:hypothetical protein
MRGTTQVLIAILAAGGIATSSLAEPAARPQVGSAGETRSIRGLSRFVLGSGAGHTTARADVQLLRARLAELRSTLDQVEADPAPERVEAMRDRKAEALAAYRAWRRAAARTEHASPATATPREHRPAARARARGVDVIAEMNSLWQDVDQAMADPIGQRVRLQLARQRIDAALARPPEMQGPSMTWRLDATADER